MRASPEWAIHMAPNRFPKMSTGTKLDIGSGIRRQEATHFSKGKQSPELNQAMKVAK
jgi:hypothetical protein